MLAVTVTEAAQIVGTLLVLSLVITPVAAAQRLSTGPVPVTLLSVALAVAAADGGAPAQLRVPERRARACRTVALSFAFYLAARLAGPAITSARRNRSAPPDLAELPRG